MNIGTSYQELGMKVGQQLSIGVAVLMVWNKGGFFDSMQETSRRDAGTKVG